MKFGIKPQSKLDVFGKLGITPVKQPGFLFESKQSDKLLIKKPNCDSPCDSIETLIHALNGEHAEMLISQEEMLEGAKAMAETNAVRIKTIEKTQMQLRSLFAKTNMFMIDCDTKRVQARLKVKQEKEVHEKLRVVNEKYRNDLKDLKLFRDKLNSTVKEMEPYERVIEEVVALGDTYDSEKDCLERCDGLMLAQAEISEAGSEKLEEIATRAKQFKKLTDDAKATIMLYLNELSQSERDLCKTRTECQKWERVLVNIKNSIAESKLMEQTVIDGVTLMFRDLCKRNGIEVLHVSFERKMNYIRDEIQILRAVYEECKKK